MIIFIDDEFTFIESYVESLIDSGLDVKTFRDINTAIDFFTENVKITELIILDVMLALPDHLPSGFNSEDSENGLRGGVELLRLLNRVPGGAKTPKIFLTNVADQEFHEEYHNSTQVQGCYRKKDISLKKLVDIVKNIVEKNN